LRSDGNALLDRPSVIAQIEAYLPAANWLLIVAESVLTASLLI
jgi:hypothetical protein